MKFILKNTYLYKKIAFFFRNFIRIGIQRFIMMFLHELHLSAEKDKLRAGKLWVMVSNSILQKCL